VVDDNELYLFLGVQQESIVVPDNVDAIRGMMGAATQAESMRLTNSSLGIAEPMK
jgi:glyceraldehyde-3-phosphate dehydrogenase (NAD(P))